MWEQRDGHTEPFARSASGCPLGGGSSGVSGETEPHGTQCHSIADHGKHALMRSLCRNRVRMPEPASLWAMGSNPGPCLTSGSRRSCPVQLKDFFSAGARLLLFPVTKLMMWKLLPLHRPKTPHSSKNASELHNTIIRKGRKSHKQLFIDS